MKLFQTIAIVAVMVGFVGAAQAEDITLSGVHLCCKGCAKGVGEAAKSAGVSASCDLDAGTVTLKGVDKKSGMKAMAALAKAGYHGKSSNKDLAMELAKAPKGKVSSLKVTGFHNCCGKCEKAITSAVAKVKGAKLNLEKKAKTFTVTGDFNARQVLMQLAKNGMHGTVVK